MDFRCIDCVTCEKAGGLAFWEELDEEVDKLQAELDERRDRGEDLFDIAVDFENRLLAFEKRDEPMTPEHMALKDAISDFHAVAAYVAYEARGWQRKHSGGWIKKKPVLRFVPKED